MTKFKSILMYILHFLDVKFALWSISVLFSAAHQTFRVIRPINETSCHKIDLSRK